MNEKIFVRENKNEMRKHFLVATLAVAIMTVFGYRSYLSQTKNEISEFALANIEALASGDFDMPEWYEKRMTRNTDCAFV
ncbi:MAG: hypothetical protein IJX44_08135 [Bacteroidaceae bacterium]|nr:hypothetical protein [Bacteroidaceae bacterium]